MSSLSPFPQTTGGANYMSMLDEEGHATNPNAPLLNPSEAQNTTPYSKPNTTMIEDDEEIRSEITREEDVLTHYQEEVRKEASIASYWGCITAVTGVFVFTRALLGLYTTVEYSLFVKEYSDSDPLINSIPISLRWVAIAIAASSSIVGIIIGMCGIISAVVRSRQRRYHLSMLYCFGLLIYTCLNVFDFAFRLGVMTKTEFMIWEPRFVNMSDSTFTILKAVLIPLFSIGLFSLCVCTQQISFF